VAFGIIIKILNIPMTMVVGKKSQLFDNVNHNRKQREKRKNRKFSKMTQK